MRTPFLFGWVVFWTGPSLLPGPSAPSRSAFISFSRCTENGAGRFIPVRTALAVAARGRVVAAGFVRKTGITAMLRSVAFFYPYTSG